jgi:SAM-dependent methyltransferase
MDNKRENKKIIMNLIDRLKFVYLRQDFYPGKLGIFINPFYFARLALSNAMINFSPSLSGNLLDIGCGNQPYRELFNVDEYIGLEIDNKRSRDRGIADKFYDGKTFPFSNASFDSALCNQVLEHVFNPDEFLGEIARVLKPGGRLLLTVPFVWDEHEQPYDYARYSSFGLKALLERQGLKIIKQRKLVSDASIIFQLTNAYLFKITQHLPNKIKFLFTATVIAFFNLLGILAAKILPDNPDLFLDHIVLAEKTS